VVNSENHDFAVDMIMSAIFGYCISVVLFNVHSCGCFLLVLFG